MFKCQCLPPSPSAMAGLCVHSHPGVAGGWPTAQPAKATPAAYAHACPHGTQHMPAFHQSLCMPPVCTKHLRIMLASMTTHCGALLLQQIPTRTLATLRQPTTHPCYSQAPNNHTYTRTPAAWKTHPFGHPGNSPGSALV